MKNNLIKFLILCGSIISVTACNSNDKSCFVVKTLAAGDDYKIKEFTEAYGKYLDENNIHYESDVTVDVVNIMPHGIFDTYGAGLFKVNINNEDKEKQAYLYYNKTLYKVSYQTFKDEEFEINSLAFTDMNKDGSYEITIAYNTTLIDKKSYLTTLDTMTLETASGLLYNVNAYFKKNGNVIGLYGVNYMLGEEKEQHFDDIRPYERNYELSRPKYELECDTYKVKLTWSRAQTNVPVEYFGLKHFFIIQSELTYLGEDFEISWGAYPWGAQIDFLKSDGRLSDLGNVGNAYASVDGTITVTNGYIFRGSTSITDTYDKKSPLGTYDMEVFFHGETILIEKALIVK